MTVRHFKGPFAEKDVFYRDGDFDAVVGECVIESAGVLRRFTHDLGRPAVGYQVIWSRAGLAEIPAVALDKNREPISDDRELGLVFSNVDTIRLRIW